MSEAADALGVTVDAVRSRVKRGTIAHERVGGRVYVLLGGDEVRPGHDQDTDLDRERFLEFSTVLLAALSFVGVLFVGLPALTILDCR